MPSGSRSGSSRATRGARAESPRPRSVKASKGPQVSEPEHREDQEAALEPRSGLVGLEGLKEAEKHVEDWTFSSHEERQAKRDREEARESQDRKSGKSALERPGEKHGSKDPTRKPTLSGAEAKAETKDVRQQALLLKSALSEIERKAAVAAASALTHVPPPPGARPPDVMTLLHDSREPGVLFQEDRDTPGGEPEDPELAAAVAEATRILAGVSGVSRIGPGRNDAEERVIVVVAMRGFGEASLRAVPPQVHRFATLVAIPYDLLPLRRER